MDFKKYLTDKKTYVFGLDDVVYPQKDYLLQVYYLFSEFLSYTEQLDASKILAFMKREYEHNGANEIFEKTAMEFSIDDKYKTNFELLHQNARLPLKLLLYKNILEFLQAIVLEKKDVFLLVDGDPLQQLNKIKQMEWHDIGQHLKVYFTAEFGPKPAKESVEFIMREHQLQKQDILLIGNDAVDESFAAKIGVDYLPLKKLM